MTTTVLRNVLVIFFIFFHCDAQSIRSAATDTISSYSIDWTVAGIGGAVFITALLFHYDQQIYDEIYSWKTTNPAIEKISPVVTNMGDGAFSMCLFGGFAGYGLIFKDTKAVEAGKIGIESFILTGMSVQLFKHLCGRERPSNSTQPGGFWHGPFAYFKKRGGDRSIAAFDAFPSGHTTTAFAAATTISDFYTDTWVSYTSYSLAALVAISRVMERTHWLSDCFVGAIIGHYGTRLVEKWNYGSAGRFTIIPQADERQYGLLLSMKF